MFCIILVSMKNKTNLSTSFYFNTGQETTAQLMSFTCEYVGRHPQVYQKYDLFRNSSIGLVSQGIIQWIRNPSNLLFMLQRFNTLTWKQKFWWSLIHSISSYWSHLMTNIYHYSGRNKNVWIVKKYTAPKRWYYTIWVLKIFTTHQRKNR